MTAIEAFESMKALIEKLQKQVSYLEVEIHDLKQTILTIAKKRR